ncbi:phosphodiesterase [Arthrobacter agilis]|nr:phosphodiesterase [Arthrobacter agilis]OUM40595.1 phosphodiesterase [Arthrobacter agilis]PPB45207.1 phosphodiesterase [Arthrobacter agilis]TPV27909.1 phosphodiesterase [Arthrobacter agilis]VDR31411.1 3',5'-cyclic adenosine monophosphate phosphodiesterase CpdA [Arthrobacter agilis]
MVPRTAEHPRHQHFILHMSDTHLLGGEGPLYGAVDSELRLQEVFEDLEASGVRPQAIVFTGDLADKGEPGAYAKLRAIVDPAAARLGATVIWAMGNHDDRAAFREGLLDETPTPAQAAAPVDAVHFVDGLRIITLDSTVPGHHHGEVSLEQLRWLEHELAVPAPHGTILALHHPPVPSVQDLAVLVELRDQRSLADVVRGSDVRTILAGHLHYSTTAMFAGVPVSVASATCYTQDLLFDGGGSRGRDGAQSYNLVHVYEETIVHSVVPAGRHASVGEVVPREETRRRLEAHGVVIADGTRSRVLTSA